MAKKISSATVSVVYGDGSVELSLAEMREEAINTAKNAVEKMVYGLKTKTSPGTIMVTVTVVGLC